MLAPAVSLIHCSLAKKLFILLMNSNSLGLMTYCSLAKELMGIKNSTYPLKYNNNNNNNNNIIIIIIIWFNIIIFHSFIYFCAMKMCSKFEFKMKENV